MGIPFIDLKRQQDRIRDKINANIMKVLDHGQYIMGPEITALEKELAGYVRVKHAISCASGTDALLMALMAYDVGPGDAILTTPFTFIATAEVISLLGATPVFVDIDPDTFNIDPSSLERAIKAIKEKNPKDYPLPVGYKKLKARGIIAVDLFGQMAEYEKIKKIAEENGLFLIEDAAQSFGASYHGVNAGAIADIAATSFFPAKPLGTYGDGGMVFTDNQELSEKMKSIRIHGQGSHKYENIRIGINGRLDTMQAAVLLAKFEIFPEELGLRDTVAQRYTNLLSTNSNITCPFVPKGLTSAWAQYSLLSTSKQKIMDSLQASKVPAMIYYPVPLHLQAAFSHLGYKKGDFPVSEQAAEQIFSIPMHPYLEKDDQKYIAEIILSAV